MTERLGRRPVDVLVVALVAAMIVATLANAHHVGAWPWLLACDLLVLGLVALLARAPRASRVAGVAALWYPFVLVAPYYAQLGVIGLDVGKARDLVVQGWEAALFGGQPSVTWHQAMPAPALSWVLHACYMAHYALFIGVPLWLWVRAGSAECERAVFSVALAFFVCFAISAFFPVAGPYYWFPRPTGPGARVATARAVYWILDSGSSYGTAFPSSHVAASWTAVLMGIRRAPRLALVAAPVALGLAAGTVYGQFHYAVDAAAGGLVALACYAAGDALRVRLARPAAPR